MASEPSSRVALERRLARALGTHDVTPEDRRTIQREFAKAVSWDDLPVAVRRLVEEIESRPTRP